METGISLDTYKIFCAVLRTGNMSAAAKELFISQPAVSMAIKQLEERLGGPLLVRTPKGVILTPEGRVLFNYLDMAFNMVKTAEHKYFELANLEQGDVYKRQYLRYIKDCRFSLPYLLQRAQACLLYTSYVYGGKYKYCIRSKICGYQ